MGPSSWVFCQATGSLGQYGQAMMPMYAVHTVQQRMAGLWPTSHMSNMQKMRLLQQLCTGFIKLLCLRQWTSRLCNCKTTGLCDVDTC